MDRPNRVVGGGGEKGEQLVLAFLAEESRVSDNAKLAVSPMLIPAALLDPEAVSVPEPIPLDLPVLP